MGKIKITLSANAGVCVEICGKRIWVDALHDTKVPGFSTLDAARQAMAKILADAVDLNRYIQALRKEDGEDCKSSADFLRKFHPKPNASRRKYSIFRFR